MAPFCMWLGELLQLRCRIREGAQARRDKPRCRSAWGGRNCPDRAHNSSLLPSPSRWARASTKLRSSGIRSTEPHVFHRPQAGGRQGMAADSPTEVEHLTAGEALLQPQGVGDVVSTVEVPGGQLQQVGRDRLRVLIEAARPAGDRSRRGAGWLSSAGAVRGAGAPESAGSQPRGARRQDC